MMMASHSHIDATASAAYVGGGRPKSRRGVRNRLLASSRAWLARLVHGRNHVPVRAPLPSHRTYVLSLSAYAGDATRSARGFLGPAARAETSEAVRRDRRVETGLRSARWDDCAGPDGWRVGKGPRNAGSPEVTSPLLSSSVSRRQVFTPAVTSRL